MNRVEELKSMVESFEDDYNKFTEKGNKTAATRARKTLQDIRNWSKDVRMEISETKKDMATA
ncbi:MAG: histone H1 [Promethearchaeota archaeon]|jgi:soluble cytochrome b562